MRPVLFVGPSLPPADQAALGPAITLLGPAACGDIARAAAAGAPAIGLIDGAFETTLAPWHKEILWALARGVPVHGAASIGALRAVELHAFGMAGLGEVFQAYRDGAIADDDEVAVVHAPAELGHAVLSEAMVNVRWTLSAAHARGILRADERDAIAGCAKAIFFKERTWPAIWRSVATDARIPPARLAALRPRVEAARVDVKRRDALALAALLASPDAHRAAPAGALFVPTVYWDRLRRRIGIGKDAEAPPYSAAASGT